MCVQAIIFFRRGLCALRVRLMAVVSHAARSGKDKQANRWQNVEQVCDVLPSAA